MSKEKEWTNDGHIFVKIYLLILALDFSTRKAQFRSAALWCREKARLRAGGALTT